MMMTMDKKTFLAILETRFIENMHMHRGISFQEIRKCLESDPDLFETVLGMEETGGEPDVWVFKESVWFVDTFPETPKGRTGVCYDKDARLARKKFPPETSAMEMAESIGISLLTEEEYAALQAMGPFDQKTSSWLLTPDDVREKGGALFGDFRFGRTFVYHNGADSYYGVRGFRGKVGIPI
jgi:hypothetical protein